MKTILVDVVNTFIIKGEGIFKEMYNLLEKYPNRKIILTGANDEQFKKHDLGNMPYEVFTLNHNPEKSDLDYYIRMLNHFGLEKDNVIYFEHNEEAIKSANFVGINTFHYDKDKRDLDGLKDFLDKVC
ncbi:MAG: hypothetical protein U9R00_00435 [Patescibacteria group bacterium]|nr:hypothetical protein [Patescibacteria group bacterium]